MKCFCAEAKEKARAGRRVGFAAAYHVRANDPDKLAQDRKAFFGSAGTWYRDCVEHAIERNRENAASPVLEQLCAIDMHAMDARLKLHYLDLALRKDIDRIVQEIRK